MNPFIPPSPVKSTEHDRARRNVLADPEARRFDAVRLGLYFYVFFGIALAIAAFRGVRIGNEETGPAAAIGPSIMSAGAILALRKRRSGYYVTLIFSIFLLLGVPIGTILGWTMIRGLRRVQHVFRRW